MIQQNPFSAFPERPASARQGGDRGEARHICHRVCERGPGSAPASPRGAGSAPEPRSLARLVGARLAPSVWLIIKWLLWLGEGRTPLALCDVLRCLAGAWQALDFLAGTRWERDGAVFVPKVTLRECLDWKAPEYKALQGGGNKAAPVQQDFAEQMLCGTGGVQKGSCQFCLGYHKFLGVRICLGVGLRVCESLEFYSGIGGR